MSVGTTLEVRLFGKFSVRHKDRELEGFDSRPVQQLFSYLLIHRRHHHHRETLAGFLWDASSTAQSKKYLRQALWQLQTAFDDSGLPSPLDSDPEWIRLKPDTDLFLDVAAFEATFRKARGFHGRELPRPIIQELEACVEHYRGELLEGWYQDWCIFERERLQNIYLAVLDKLTDAHEDRGDYEIGLTYAMRILRYDRARERTHRRLMRLYYLAGDRTAALRQYATCVAALEEELGVAPARRTKILLERIRGDEPLPAFSSDNGVSPVDVPTSSSAFLRLKRLKDMLVEVQRHTEQDLERIERALGGDG